MTGQGAGPSRRSHTKSRTGCKTCKRRHIRCDESFPQCRNCTKHQVECDYRETMPPEGELHASVVEQVKMQPTPTPGGEHAVHIWLQTGNFPFPELQIFPLPQPQAYSEEELHLICHVSSISHSLFVNGTSGLDVWAGTLPKYLSIASSYPFVMHAFLAFSASHLAWTSPGSDARKMQIQHGSIAMRGVHDAITSFSKSNADAVLAASCLLMAQANDWRTWSSLGTGIRSVSSAMEEWKHESLFAELINVLPTLARDDTQSLPSTQERHAILGDIVSALHRLQPFLAGHEIESQWLDQLMVYIQTLAGSRPAQTPIEQFDQLYRLRKWIIFVPSLFLTRASFEGPSLLLLAHLYAIALALEPLFPNLGPSFCSAISLVPLEHILRITAPMQMEQNFGRNALEIDCLMQFPQQAAMAYHAYGRRRHQAEGRIPSPSQQQLYPVPGGFDMDSPTYTPFASASPGLIHVPPPPSARHSRMSSGSQSPFLEVPTAGPMYERPTFGYGGVDWGAAPSPAFPPQAYSSQDEEQGYNSDMGAPGEGFSGGSTLYHHPESKGKGRRA